MTPLIAPANKVIATIVKDIAHLPSGYQFLQSLPITGRKSQRCLLRRWAALTLTTLFPVQLRQAALLASLDENGVPDSRCRALYSWLLKVVYRHNASQLHNDWLLLKQAVEDQPSLLLKPKVKKRREIKRPANMPRKGMYHWHTYPPSKKPIAPPTPQS